MNENELIDCKTTLLIVDDEPDIREILSDMLGEVTDTILTAADGKEALEITEGKQIDCIVSDFQMPRMTGIELLEHLTAKDSLTPFVMLTGHSDQENLTHALRLGALDFIAKPFLKEQVTSVIIRALEIGKRKRAYQAKVNELVARASELGVPQAKAQLDQDRKMLQLLRLKNSSFWKDKSKKKA